MQSVVPRQQKLLPRDPVLPTHAHTRGSLTGNTRATLHAYAQLYTRGGRGASWFRGQGRSQDSVNGSSQPGALTRAYIGRII